MNDEKIVLDKKSFGALAVDSRVNILKALRERRKTLTELSGELKLSVSSTKEHLERLEQAELVVKVEEGHKWKYYELTKKGSKLVSPDTEIRVWVLLGTALVAFAYSIVLLSMSGTSYVPPDAAVQQETYATADGAAKALNEAYTSSPQVPLGGSESISATVARPDPLPVIIAILSIAAILVCVYWIMKKRK